MLRAYPWVLLSALLGTSHLHAEPIDEIIVLSSPFQKTSDKTLSTVDVLSGRNLENISDLALGGALSALPGVSNASFGPAVGQPIIRGLGGYRIDTLVHHMPLGDIAGAGNDHVNGLDLFDVKHIEVVKGPAALRYGPFAGSGIVNAFNRHFEENTEEKVDTSMRYGSAARERIVTGYARAGAIATSAFWRDTDNVRVPTHAESAYQLAAEEEQAEINAHRVQNTATKSRGVNLSGHFGESGRRIVVFFSGLDSRYGVPGHAHGDEHGDEQSDEAPVSIELKQTRLQALIERDLSGAIFDQMRVNIMISDYDQRELERALIGTRFEQKAYHLRTEVGMQTSGWNTLFGIDAEQTDLSTRGEEAYIPSNKHEALGFFAYTEKETASWLMEFALRADKSRVERSEGASLHHDAFNLSAGIGYSLSPELILGGSLTHIERAPAPVELLADGVHVAANRGEKGNPSLKVERGQAAEIYIRNNIGRSSLGLSLFDNDYDNFIYLKSLDPSSDPISFAYEQVEAHIYGFELQAGHEFEVLNMVWDSTLSYSQMRGRIGSGEALRAIPPEELGISLATEVGHVSLQFDAKHAFAQERTSVGEFPTKSFSRLDASMEWRLPQIEGLSVSASLRNITDEEIRHHASVLKDLMPEAGRDFRLTLRLRL
jgi:iron complex outermembrane receptor protein